MSVYFRKMPEIEEYHKPASRLTDDDAEPGSSSEAMPTNPQPQSGFFSALPLEIRQNIYRHLWIAAGSTQHVYKASPSPLAPLSHCACISDPDAEDVREIKLTNVLEAPPAEQAPECRDGAFTAEAMAQRDEINDWRLRNASLWCNHWACEEEPPVLRPVDDSIGDSGGDKKKRRTMVKEFSPFLAILLACKRMHQEAVDSMYDDTAFTFIGIDALSRFLETTNAESLVRINTLHLIWAASIESYMDPEDEEAITAKMQWFELWSKAADKLPRLKELRIWIDEVYLDAAVNYTLDMTAAIQAVGFISPWLRPFLASRAPQVKKLHHRFQQADDFLRPVVTARRQAALHGLNEKDKPDDMLQWLMDSQDKFGQQSDRAISKYQLSLTFAAIHTTTAALTNAFYNLAATPDLVATLRQEVEEVLAETDGSITAAALQKMVKLDSFLKEIMRYYPQSATAFQRKVMKPVTLPNGQTIPTGVILEVPSHAINYDERYTSFRMFLTR
ncbi:hypothetical protein COL940_010680 [Colletotrichum noveboracense]|nr:hypothetical protein COL940_010680 [Colletotrichum noveboracense]KAJ0277925.1 hypothetical protein CBS470a_010042 [Colletotrichum nupharicola]